MTNPPKFAFFFGSGLSYDSYSPLGRGVGTVQNITNRLLGEKWRYSAERFYPADPKDDPIFLEEAERSQEFLRLVKAEIDPHLIRRYGQESHYEDLFAAVYHLWSDEMAEVVSPLVARSLRALQDASAPICARMRGGAGAGFPDLMRHSLRLIQSVVLAELGRPVRPVNLDLITKIARRVGQMDIFSLNHDGLVESQLETTGIDYTDGFEDRQVGYRIYCPKWDRAPVRVLKLHGSLNWSDCYFTKSDGSRIEQTTIFSQPADKCTYDGNPIDVRDDLQFLTGTTVKENSYGYDIIGDLFMRFRDFSSGHRTLFVCGYGWGDKGINIRLNQWLRDQPMNKMVILHEGDAGLVIDKRFWQTRWTKYHPAGKAKILPHWLPHCSEDMLFDELVV